MKEIDARKYMFTDFAGTDGPWGFLGLSEAVEEVVVTHLDNTEFTKNGVRFSFYGSCRVNKSSGMLLKDGSLLFCIISGSQFTDTFHSADNISMQYYRMHLTEQEMKKKKLDAEYAKETFREII